jgi:hypothetical protein
MAANGIKLTPMRMGDLVSNSVAKPTSKYMPPSRRTGSDGKAAPIVEKIDMTDKNFPSLGSVPMKVPGWGKHVLTKQDAIATPEALDKPEAELKVVSKKETLSDKIKEKIRLDAIADELGASKEELDPWKMTDAQLDKAGWVRLRLGSAKEICMNGFTNQGNPYIPGFIEEADTGMSFEEYIHYKKPMSSKEPVKPYSTPLPEDEDEYSDIEDY